jgi:hypothetical protein
MAATNSGSADPRLTKSHNSFQYGKGCTVSRLADRLLARLIPGTDASADVLIKWCEACGAGRYFKLWIIFTSGIKAEGPGGSC